MSRRILSRYRSKFRLAIKFSLISAVTLILTIAWITPGMGQFSLASETPGSSYQTPWWDYRKAKPCGRLLCSQVQFMESIGKDFTVAIRPESKQGEEVSALEVEKRSRLIENTYFDIRDRIIKVYSEGKNNNSSVISEKAKSIKQNLSIDWDKISSFFLIGLTAQDLHPFLWGASDEQELPPEYKIKVSNSVENQLSVVIVQTNEKWRLAQQTIVTVTEDDALHNGKSIDDLAKEWRDIIRANLSAALWEYEISSRYPGLRVGIIIVIFLLTGLLLVAIGLARKLLRFFERRLRKQIQELQASLTSVLEPGSSGETKEVAVKESEETSGKSETQAEDKETSPLHSESASTYRQTSSLTAKESSFLAKAVAVKNWLWQSLQALQQNREREGANQLNAIRQQRNLIQLSVRLLLWVQVCIFLLGVTYASTFLPITLPYASFFFRQAIALPGLWAVLNLANTISDILIDYYLNEWSKEAQLANPSSQRYTLRVSTYSPVLKGASTFLFFVLAIAWTMKLLTIQVKFSTEAQVVALGLAILARSLLEDMINGAMILISDRYAIGDVIIVLDNVGGQVEKMNLHTTHLRNIEGRSIAIPNSQIQKVENLTKEWSQVDFLIDVAYEADVQRAIEILEEVAEQMQNEPEWQEQILEPANILGVDRVSHAGVQIRMLIKTQPMKQWGVGREFRLRVKLAFDREKIAIGVPQQTWRMPPPDIFRKGLNGQGDEESTQKSN
ncbi:MAG: mechanosensitive ion channel family protein [Prochloraceae cyanobacterium]